MGIGGVGKTQLITELLFRTRQKHRYCSIIWISAVSHESLLQGYASAADGMNIPGHDTQGADVVELVREYLSEASSGQWLLIFDNADDPGPWIQPRQTGQDADTAHQKLRLIDRLPKSQRGCIIFTTRNGKLVTKVAGSNIISLPSMDQLTAAIMLRQYLVDLCLVDDAHTTEQLLTELAHLPLAIVQATAYINANGITLEDYLQVLHEPEEHAIELLSEDFEADCRYLEIKNPSLPLG